MKYGIFGVCVLVGAGMMFLAVSLEGNDASAGDEYGADPSMALDDDVRASTKGNLAALVLWAGGILFAVGGGGLLLLYLMRGDGGQAG